MNLCFLISLPVREIFTRVDSEFQKRKADNELLAVEVEQLEEQLRYIEAETRSEAERCAAKSAAASISRDNIEKLTSEFAKFQSEHMHDLCQQSQRSQEHHTKALANIKSLHDDLSIVRKLLMEMTADLAHVNGETNSLIEDFTSQKLQLEELKAQNKAEEESIAELNSEINDLGTQLNLLQEDLEQKQKGATYSICMFPCMFVF